MPIGLRAIWTRVFAAWIAIRRRFSRSRSPASVSQSGSESTQFIIVASAHARRQLADVEARLQQQSYVPRLLIREGTNAEEVVLTRQMGIRQDNPLTEEELDRVPQVVIIGNAGAGKSLTLHQAFAIAARQFLSDPTRPFPLLLDLGADLAVDMEIQPALDLRHRDLFSRARAEHSAGCALFFDALDEAIRHAPQFVNNLRRFINDNGRRIAQLTITCRRTVWDPQWTRPPFEPTVYQLDYLDRGAYEHILPTIAQRTEFYRICEALGIADLLDIPFHGFYLAREFAGGRNLPGTRWQLVDQRITDALQTRGSRAGPATDRLRFLAQQLACVASFTPRGAWTTQEAIDLLGTSRVLVTRQRPLPEEIEALVTRPLFRKTADRYAFDHQLLQEHLSAEALVTLAARKQRQLLQAPIAGSRRIHSGARGVAMALAERDAAFAEWLVEADPFVALFVQEAGASGDRKRQLLEAVFAEVLDKRLSPWDERYREQITAALRRHRPPEIASFLQPYLEHSDSLIRLWATICADVWGGTTELNSSLAQLARTVGENPEIRRHALAAIEASGDETAIRQMYHLLEDPDDRVRGEAIRIYRNVERPTPADTVALFLGGARDHTLLSNLHLEAMQFGQSLGAVDLGEAFAAVERYFVDLRDVRPYLLFGLFRRARELRFTDIPARLIVRAWVADDLSENEDVALRELLGASSALLRAIWRAALDLITQDEDVSEHEVAKRLGRIAPDQILDLIPPSVNGLTRVQQRFVATVLWQYYWVSRSPARRRAIQERAPAFADQIMLDEPPPAGAEAVERVVRAALDRYRSEPVELARHILDDVRRVRPHTRFRGKPAEDDLVDILNEISPALRESIASVFEQFVVATDFRRVRTGARAFLMLDSLAFAVVWAARHLGARFGWDKIAEILVGHGFSSATDDERYIALLDELRRADRTRWQQALEAILEDDTQSLHYPVKHLLEHSEDFYLTRAQERLERGQFDISSLDELVEYVGKRQPTGYQDTLRRCYQLFLDAMTKGQAIDRLSDEARFKPLIALLAVDDDWAWEELAGIIGQGHFPRHDLFWLNRVFLMPRNPARLRVLADLYANIRTNLAPQDSARLPHQVLRAIIETDGEDAIRELRRIQGAHGLRDDGWLNDAILQITDRLLAGVPWEPGPLLDFVNRDRLAIIMSQHDLFEWTCDVIEELKVTLEQRGLGVAGFWNVTGAKAEPKSEIECQNVLWVLLDPLLRSGGLPIVTIQERFVGPDRCDFWVLYPRRDQSHFSVAVELKVARERYTAVDLIDPVESQLYKDYMRPEQCDYGIYIVLWFRDDNRYKGPTVWADAQTLETEIHRRCRAIERSRGATVAGYVLNMTALYRRH